MLQTSPFGHSGQQRGTLVDGEQGVEEEAAETDSLYLRGQCERNMSTLKPPWAPRLFFATDMSVPVAFASAGEIDVLPTEFAVPEKLSSGLETLSAPYKCGKNPAYLHGGFTRHFVL